MNTQAVQFCKYSNTIRQFPQNYCLAVFNEEKKCWIMEPDLAADKGIVVALTLSLMDHSNKWSADPLHAIMDMAEHLPQD
jgi:hypothetical protein